MEKSIFLKKAKPLFIGILVMFVLGAAVFFATKFWRRQNENPGASTGKTIGQILQSKFDGEIAALRLPPPTGVMIENELLARSWQQGLSFADIVYEAPTEGRITRFLAIYLPGSYRGKIGPVRSARSYFLDWMHEWKGMYAHVGGRFDALARLRKEKGVTDADQFFFENYYRRENLGRVAYEHTVFTSGERLAEFIADKNLTWDIPAHFLEKRGAEPDWQKLPEAENININFGLPSYHISYEYDEARGRYLRNQAGKAHIDNATGEQISAKTVIVQHVKSSLNGDAAGSISIKTIGEGVAEIYFEGRALEATWKKEGLDMPTRWYAKNGDEITALQLPVWIEVMPDV